MDQLRSLLLRRISGMGATQIFKYPYRSRIAHGAVFCDQIGNFAEGKALVLHEGAGVFDDVAKVLHSHCDCLVFFHGAHVLHDANAVALRKDMHVNHRWL